MYDLLVYQRKLSSDELVEVFRGLKDFPEVKTYLELARETYYDSDTYKVYAEGRNLTEQFRIFLSTGRW